MKKLAIVIVLLVSIRSFSQDTGSVKKLWLGLGPTWGTLGWGGNINVYYNSGKNLSIRVRAVLGASPEKSYAHPDYGFVRSSSNFDFSASANYYIFGSTDKKTGLYIGLGAGYFYQETKNTNLYPQYNFTPSYKENIVASGLALNGSLGMELKFGPGKLYAEGYFSCTVIGRFFYSDIYYQVMPAGFITHNYKDRMSLQNGYQAIVCVNGGYKIPF